jgi:hypothetical protein
MNAYDGCHVTIQVPVDFGNEKEKELRQTFDQELPGVWLTVHGRESVTKPRISELSIDEFAYVRGAKAAEEWKNVAEKAELNNVLFQSSIGQRAEPYDNSFRVTNERLLELIPL